MALSPWLSSLLLVLGLLLSPSARGEEWVVDPRGFGDTFTIDAAVNFAADGDVIIVRPGDYYERLEVSGKGLWIVAQQPGGLTRITGGLEIEGVPVDSQFVLRDIEIAPVLGDLPLRIQSSDGLVQLVNCRFIASDAPAQGLILRAAAVLDNARRVNAINSDFVAAIQANALAGAAPSGGDPGVIMRESRLAAWGSELRGGPGVSNLSSLNRPPGVGGTAIVMDTSKLFLSSSTAIGGVGGANGNLLGGDGADGGPGLTVDMNSEAFVVDSLVDGGAGGPPASISSAFGMDGVVATGAGSTFFLQGHGELHQSSPFARNRSDLDVRIEGRPGLDVDLYQTTRIPPYLFDRGDLWLFVRANAPIAQLGPMPATGELLTTLSVPDLPVDPATLTATFIAHLNRGGRGAVLGPPIPIVGVNCDSFGDDCDASGRSDLCEIIEGTATDVDRNGRVDGCNDDCNGNGVLDFFDIQSGTSLDANGDGVPDECGPAGVRLYVDPNAIAGGDGSRAAPFQNIKDAVAANETGDEVILMDGVYTGFENRSVSIFSSSLTIRSENGPDACVIDTGALPTAFEIQNFVLRKDVVIEGIRFRFGETFGAFGDVLELSSRADVVVRNCIFEPGMPFARTHIISMSDSDVLLEGCEFHAFTPGGQPSGDSAIVTRLGFGGSLSINDCLFNGFRSFSESGSAIESTCPEVTITRSRFVDCGVSGSVASAGAIYLRDGDVRIDQCLFVGNRSGIRGADITPFNSNVDISNCTFIGDGPSHGASIAVEAGSSVRVDNSIVFGTGVEIEVTDIGFGGAVLPTDLTIRSTHLAMPPLVTGQPSLTTVGLLLGDPGFSLPAGPDGDPSTYLDNDYSLGPLSPLIDAGANGLLAADANDLDGDGNRAEPVPLDLLGQPRRRDDLLVPDTGTGGAPVVDPGCFERQ